MSEECPKCRGCGQIANSDEGEPWSLWESLPTGSDVAVRMGLVRPIPCPSCSLAGRVRQPQTPTTGDDRCDD